MNGPKVYSDRALIPRVRAWVRSLWAKLKGETKTMPRASARLYFRIYVPPDEDRLEVGLFVSPPEPPQEGEFDSGLQFAVIYDQDRRPVLEVYPHPDGATWLFDADAILTTLAAAKEAHETSVLRD